MINLKSFPRNDACRGLLIQGIGATLPFLGSNQILKHPMYKFLCRYSHCKTPQNILQLFFFLQFINLYSIFCLYAVSRFAFQTSKINQYGVCKPFKCKLKIKCPTEMKLNYEMFSCEISIIQLQGSHYRFMSVF